MDGARADRASLHSRPSAAPVLVGGEATPRLGPIHPQDQMSQAGNYADFRFRLSSTSASQPLTEPVGHGSDPTEDPLWLLTHVRAARMLLQAKSFLHCS
jgi:hypothetical protein